MTPPPLIVVVLSAPIWAPFFLYDLLKLSAQKAREKRSRA